MVLKKEEEGFWMAERHLDGLTLSLLADEMLDKREAEEYHRHIATCKDCEQAYDDVVAMSFAMAKLEDVEPIAGYGGFAQGILDKLPEQDPVSKEKTMEIREHRVKENWFASLHWQQVLGYGAMAAVLATMFLPRQEQGHDPSVMGGEVATYGEAMGEDTSGEAGLVMSAREMEEQVEQTDSVTMATPTVVEDYSPAYLEEMQEALEYYTVEGLTLSESQELDIVYLIERLRTLSGREDLAPVVLVFLEKPELDGTWASYTAPGGALTYTTRDAEELTEYLPLFPEVTGDMDYFLLVL